MKKTVIILLVGFCFSASAQQQQSLNMVLLSHWNDSTLNHCDDDQIWNNLTGWKDTVKNREYLIAGSCDSIYFFDITDPTQMIKCDVQEGHSRNAINRDYDTYSHYMYCVSDRSSPLGALQIFDLQFLPDSVHKVYDYDSLSVNSHTLFIEAKSKRLYLCGNNYKPAGARAMSILSLENPEHPYYIGEVSSGTPCAYVHETFVKNDTAYCSCGYNGLYIYDVRDATNPVLIGSIVSYPYSGFNHSSWLDATGKYLMFTDELQLGLPIKIYDVSDIANAKLVSLFNSHDLTAFNTATGKPSTNNPTPHNAKWKGRYGWVSSYEDGVYSYDLLDPAHPKIAGYYDTYMKNADTTYNGFHGCWGVYPFLPSGNIIASDISEGLFVLRPTITLGTENVAEEKIHATISPNPVNDQLHIRILSQQKTMASVIVMDMLGKIIVQKNMIFMNGENEFFIDELKDQTEGLYIIQINTNTSFWSAKFLKQ